MGAVVRLKDTRRRMLGGRLSAEHPCSVAER